MPTIRVTNNNGDNLTFEARVGDTVMSAAVMNGFDGIDADCGGACSCATCHVIIAQAWYDLLPAKSEDEDAMLEFATEREANSRLSCQIQVTDALDGLEFRLPSTQR